MLDLQSCCRCTYLVEALTKTDAGSSSLCLYSTLIYSIISYYEDNACSIRLPDTVGASNARQIYRRGSAHNDSTATSMSGLALDLVSVINIRLSVI